MSTYNRAQISIISLTIATSIIGLWPMFSEAPHVFKFTYAILAYICLFFFPFSYTRRNDFGTTANSILLLLAIDSVLQILMTIYNTDPDIYAYGNKWLTLVLNENSIIALFPPFFVYYAKDIKCFHDLSKYLFTFGCVAFVFSIIKTINLEFLSVFSLAFFPYVSKKNRLIIIAAIIISIFMGIIERRMLLILNAYAIAAFIIVYVIKLKWLQYVFCFICLLTPCLVFIPILDLAKNELSFFQTLMQYLAENNIISDGEDTRTFLYLEMAEDLRNNQVWMFGKGAYCHYFSSYFSVNEGGSPFRLGSEVPFLNMLLHGGIIYIILYYSLLIWAIIKGLFYGKNLFVQIASLLIAGWIFNTFVGDLTGCRFYHICFFFLVGCCLSKKIRLLSDLDIQLLFDNKYHKFQVLKLYVLRRIINASRGQNGGI